MPNSPMVYSNSSASGKGTVAAFLVAQEERRSDTSGPILLGPAHAGNGAVLGGNVSEVTHPFARARSPLASSEISGGRWAQVAYVVFDMALVGLNFVLAAKLRALSTYGAESGFYLPPHSLGFLLLYGPIIVLFAHTQGLYRTARDRSRLDESFAVAKAVCLATVLLGASIYASGVRSMPRLIVWGGAALNIVALSGWRFWKRGLVERRLASGVGVKNVLIVGAGKVGREVANYLDANKQLGLVVKGFLDQRPVADPRVLGRVEDLCAIARAEVHR